MHNVQHVHYQVPVQQTHHNLPVQDSRFFGGGMALPFILGYGLGGGFGGFGGYGGYGYPYGYGYGYPYGYYRRRRRF